ncbi:MAG: FAD-dependent oxidoreductase [Nanoarchaeota archaeon]|nr:FAD-dependent oxidoreductase [Nanoarchaeota archaeon]
MKNKRIIIVGMGPAATGAAAAIQHTNKNAEITLIEKKIYESYSPCGMPFALEGKMNFEDLKHSFPSKGLKSKVYINTEAKSIDTKRKELWIQHDEKIEILDYDSLIIATGTEPLIPPIPNVEKFLQNRNAFTVASLESVVALYTASMPADNITIIGAGAIGLEFAVAIKRFWSKVLVAEMMPQVFPNALDSDMARHVQEYLESKDIKVLTNSKVESMNGSDKLESLTINKTEYKSDAAVLACGNKPSIKIIQDTPIIYTKNGIVTDKKMMTNIKNVYAIGDCVETNNFLTKKRCRSALAVPARKQGRVAGINATGGKAIYEGTLNTFISVLDDYAVGATGLTAEQAKSEGYEVSMQKIKGTNIPDWYPGNKQLIIKIIADKKGKLLGGQVFGEKYATKGMIDVISSYLTRNSNLKAMMNGELSYCPDVANLPDPLTTTLDFLLRRKK